LHGIKAPMTMRLLGGPQADIAQSNKARSLFDNSRGRATAIQLAAAFTKAETLYREAITERRRIEADTSTKDDVLRAQWKDFGADYEAQIRDIRAEIKTHTDELETALQDEALPLTADTSAILVARGEVEAALRVANGEARQTMVALAGRGGDIAAAASSEWGRLVYVAANGGDDVGFDLVRDEAIRTALTSGDEGRRRAAAALQALTTPRRIALGAVASRHSRRRPS
jgi:hypothetical protein